MKPQSAGEQSISKRILKQIAGLGSCTAEGTRHHLRPQFQILPGIAHHGRVACCAAGNMNFHRLPARKGKQAEGVMVAQVQFGRKRQFGNILDAPDIRRAHAGLVQLLPIEGTVLIYVVNKVNQPFRLKILQILQRHRFDFFIPNHK